MTMDLVWNDVKMNLKVLFPLKITAYSVPRFEFLPVSPERIMSRSPNPDIYPHLCERIERYVSEYYEAILLPPLIPLQGFNLLRALKIKWGTCLNMSSPALMYSLELMRKAYIESNGFSDDTDSRIFIQSVVRTSFRLHVYNEFADILRRNALLCIMDDHSIQYRRYLQRHISLIKSLSCNSTIFCKYEWEHSLMTKILVHLPAVIASWRCNSTHQLLNSVEQHLSLYKSLFIQNASKNLMQEKFLDAVGPQRDSVLFRNEGAALNAMVETEEGLTDIRRIAQLFGHDEDLIRMMAQHYTKYFKACIYGKRGDFSSVLLSDDWKTVISTIINIWHKIDIFQLAIERWKVIRSAMGAPFLELFTSPGLSLHFTVVFQTALANYMDELLFPRRPTLHMDAESEMWKLLSFVSNLPFPYTFKVVCEDILTTKVEKGWSPHHSAAKAAVEYLLSASNGKVGFERKLRDVRSWSLYTLDLRTPLKEFQNKHSTIVELQVIQRGNWEKQCIHSQLRLPSSMAEFEQTFQEYFSKKHENRSTSIDSCGGRVLVKCQFWNYFGKKVLLEGCTGQMCVLEQFQVPEPKRVGDICEKVTVDQGANGKKAVVGILDSLMKEVPVLVRCEYNDLDRSLEEGDMLQLNLGYEPKSHLLQLPKPVMRDRFKNPDNDDERWVTEFCEKAVQCLVMRCMKERRVIEMADLERAVLQRLKLWYDIGKVGVDFAEIVGKLVRKEDIEVENTVVRYIP